MDQEERHIIDISKWSDERRSNVFSEENGWDDGLEIEERDDPEFAFVEDEIEDFEEKGWVTIRVVVRNWETGRFYETTYIRSYDLHYGDTTELSEVFPYIETTTKYG